MVVSDKIRVVIKDGKYIVTFPAMPIDECEDDK